VTTVTKKRTMKDKTIRRVGYGNKTKYKEFKQ